MSETIGMHTLLSSWVIDLMLTAWWDVGWRKVARPQGRLDTQRLSCSPSSVFSDFLLFSNKWTMWLSSIFIFCQWSVSHSCLTLSPGHRYFPFNGRFLIRSIKWRWTSLKALTNSDRLRCMRMLLNWSSGHLNLNSQVKTALHIKLTQNCDALELFRFALLIIAIVCSGEKKINKVQKDRGGRIHQ